MAVDNGAGTRKSKLRAEQAANRKLNIIPSTSLDWAVYGACCFIVFIEQRQHTTKVMHDRKREMLAYLRDNVPAHKHVLFGLRTAVESGLLSVSQVFDRGVLYNKLWLVKSAELFADMTVTLLPTQMDAALGKVPEELAERESSEQAALWVHRMALVVLENLKRECGDL